MPAPDPSLAPPRSPDADAPSTRRALMRRLREIHRSAGWPCGDMLELALLAGGLIERCFSSEGHLTFRLSQAGIEALATTHASHQRARDPHETLVQRVADQLVREGRLAWRGLALRAPLPAELLPGAGTDQPATAPSQPPLPWDVAGSCAEPALAANSPAHRWCTAMPDVFSLRRSSVEAYLEPVVHEIKVSRADLLGDLRKPAKRAAYLAMAGAVWYVLGEDRQGRPIARPEEVPPECGVLQLERGALVVARPAPRRAMERLPFHVWMALAQAGPHLRSDEDPQSRL